MKKIKYLLLLLVMVGVTGCVKFNVNMDIKKDKKMDFSIIYAINSSLLGDNQLLEDSDKNKLKDEGFSVKDYVDGDMKGYILSRTINNIDDVSTTSDTKYSLSGILEENADSYLFTVKRGLLKNTYKAEFNFDTSDSNLNNDLTGTDTKDDNTEVNPSEEEDSNTEINDDLDFSALASSMDLSFNVNLPYSAKSNNATSSLDGNKKLSWKLDSSGMDAIKFEFELYNMTNIYVVIGIIALFIILVVVIILCIRKGNKTSKSEKAKDESQEKAEIKKEAVNTQGEPDPSVSTLKDTEPITPVAPSNNEEKKEEPVETKVANSMEAINIVPLPATNEPPKNLEPVEKPFEHPSTVPSETPVIPVAPVTLEPQTVVPPVLVNPTAPEATPEVKNDAEVSEAPSTNKQSEEKKPKIEQLEDGL